MSNCKECSAEFTPKRKDTQYCCQACGNTYRGRKYRETTGQTREGRAKRKALLNQPLAKYHMHKASAKKRGVGFKLSFKEWWSLWKDHWKDRGVGKLVMCRLGDSGPYELGNVRIDTHTSNMQEWQDLRKVDND